MSTWGSPRSPFQDSYLPGRGPRRCLSSLEVATIPFLPPSNIPPYCENISIRHSRPPVLLLVITMCGFPVCCVVSIPLASARFTSVIAIYRHPTSTLVLSFSPIGPYIDFDSQISRTIDSGRPLGGFRGPARRKCTSTIPVFTALRTSPLLCYPGYSTRTAEGPRVFGSLAIKVIVHPSSSCSAPVNTRFGSQGRRSILG